MRILIIILSLFFICCSNHSDRPTKKFIISDIKSGSFDSIQNLMDYQKSFNFYKDKFYSVTRLDNGEWGGAAFFTDSITKKTWALSQSAIYGFGKSDSSYLLFCYSGSGLCGKVTEILNPTKLYQLNDSTRLIDPGYLYNKSDSILKSTNLVRQITDLKDSIYDYVGVFSKNNQLYIIKSTKLFSDYPKYTILCTLNLSTSDMVTIDTLLHEQIYTFQQRPWPNNAPVYNPFSKKVLIPIRSNDYKGFIEIKSDTITVIKDKASL